MTRPPDAKGRALEAAGDIRGNWCRHDGDQVAPQCNRCLAAAMLRFAADELAAVEAMPGPAADLLKAAEELERE